MVDLLLTELNYEPSFDCVSFLKDLQLFFRGCCESIFKGYEPIFKENQPSIYQPEIYFIYTGLTKA